MTTHPDSDYAKRKTIRIKRNIYGNYVCFVGKDRITDYGNERDAVDWAAKLVKGGQCVVSDKSDVTANEVAIYIHNWL